MTPTTGLFMDVDNLKVADGFTGRDAIGPFLRLSAVLVGRPDLEDWVGRAYLKTLAGFAVPAPAAPAGAPGRTSPTYTAEDIKKVLDRFVALERQDGGDPALLARQVQSELLRSSDAGMADVTRSVAALWYCAGIIEFDSGKGFMLVTAPVETYSSALVWKAIGGNPMGIPGPYYGNWAYPAPVQIVPPDSAAGSGDGKPQNLAAKS